MARVTRTAALAFGLIGAVVASQLPEYSQQYRQRLGGAIDELSRIVDRFEQDSRDSGETPESAIARLRSNPDALAANQGVAMEGNRDRLARLAAHREAMIEAGPFSRVGLMLREADTDIMRAAYRDFEPAMPVTEEGLAAAAGGFVALWGGLLLLAGFARSLVRGSRGKPTPRGARSVR